jgi:NAD-dependent DNA ligase
MSDKDALKALMRVKYIGTKRAQALLAAGVDSIEQLRGISESDLAAIKTVGPHYARLIRNALNQALPDQLYQQSHEAHKANTEPSNDVAKPLKRCRKRLRKVKKALKHADEQLKPLWRRKYTLDYLAYKKHARSARKQISKINRRLDDLSPKKVEKITAAAKALLRALVTIPSKPKRKHYRKAVSAVTGLNRILTKVG